MNDWAKKSSVLDYYLDAGDMLRFAFDGIIQKLLQEHLEKKYRWPSHECIRKMEKFLGYLRTKTWHYSDPFTLRFEPEPKTFSLVWPYGVGEAGITFSENSKSCDVMWLYQLDVSDKSLKEITYNKKATNICYNDVDQDPSLIDNFCKKLFTVENNECEDTFSRAEQIFYFLNQLSTLAKKNGLILPYPEPININNGSGITIVYWKFAHCEPIFVGTKRCYFPKTSCLTFKPNKITGDLFVTGVNLLPSDYDLDHLNKTEYSYIVMPKTLQEDESDWILFLEKSFQKCTQVREPWDGNKEKFLHTISFFIQNENEEETK